MTISEEKKMSSKDKIQSSYLRKQLTEHGWKVRPEPSTDLMIAITGAGKEGSIGQAIMSKFPTKINAISPDVIFEDFDFSNYSALIMCHGYTYMDWIENVPDEETQKIIDTNLYGTIRMVRQFVNATIKAPHRKKVITIGSMAYTKILNGSAAYCASKAGLNMFIKCAAWELAPKGFDFYIINPSNVVDTPMTKDTIEHLMRYRNLSEEEANMYWATNSIRECLLTKEEIACYIEYIMLNDSEYLTGSSIDLAGGQR
jgi:NAD(P)-dependent dehydrogenase (short-subunit alcohol dehydrogenase family)